MRERYWLVNENSAVRRVIGRCAACRRMDANVSRQPIAPPPLCLTEDGWWSFSSAGVDYFGPIPFHGGRKLERSYGCLFTCPQKGAVHPEVALKLETNSLITTLVMLLRRRGAPREIYSNDGISFACGILEPKNGIIRLDQK